MKLVMDEKLKHRLIGLAVIISLGAIFAPAMMRKSSQKLEGNFSTSIKLPSKPVAPDVTATDEKEMFKTIKVARVEIPGVPAEKQLPQLVHAEPIKKEIKTAENTIEASRLEAIPKETVQLAVNEAAKSAVKKEIILANQDIKPKQVVALKQHVVPSVVKIARKPQVIKHVQAKKVALQAKKQLIKKEIFAVQLASFSQVANAQALVKQLQSKGYKANYSKFSSKNGPMYKVQVGHSSSKNDVLKVKNQLASSMRLNGFIVNTGVS